MNSKLIPIDALDPVDIAMLVDPEVSRLMDSVESHEDDYETLYAGIKINESSDEEDGTFDDMLMGDIDTFDAIDDNSTDPLDIEADEMIANYEPEDSDGELIDIILSGEDISELLDGYEEEEEE